MKPTRQQAWELLNEYNQDEYLIKHALSVEGVMAYCARLLGEADVEKWSIIGLLHDLDYERYPEEHCVKVQEILKERGYDAEFIHAIASHGHGICVDLPPEHQMEKVLFATDELTGLITACAIMRPSRSVMDLEVKSVMKKFKTANFAAKISREIIEQGAVMVGWSLEELIQHTILGMREVAEEIGLAG